MDGPPPVQAAVKTEKRWETRREPAVGAGHQALLGAAEIILPKSLLSLFQARTRSEFCPEEGGESHSPEPFQGEVPAPKGEGVVLHCSPDACLAFVLTLMFHHGQCAWRPAW